MWLEWRRQGWSWDVTSASDIEGITSVCVYVCVCVCAVCVCAVCVCCVCVCVCSVCETANSMMLHALLFA